MYSSLLFSLLCVLCGLCCLFCVYTSLFWKSNTNYLESQSCGFHSYLSGWRIIFAVSLSTVIVRRAIARKHLTLNGGIAAFPVGLFLSLSNYCFFSALLGFFVSSSVATKYAQHSELQRRCGRGDQNQRFQEQSETNGRTASQVIANGLIPTVYSLIYLLECGVGEAPIDFSRNYLGSSLCISVLAALCCAAGDTWSSELGPPLSALLYRTGHSTPLPRLITTWKPVPVGTNGAVSLAGLLCSVFGGVLVGLSYFVGLFFTNINAGHLPNFTQFLLFSGLMGLLGSVADSVLGATLQYSGLDSRTGQVTEVAPSSSEQAQHHKFISGWSLLNNDAVNLLSIYMTAAHIGPPIALLVL